MDPIVLTTQRAHECRILIERGLHTQAGEVLNSLRPLPSFAGLVSDRDVASLWLEPVERSIKATGIRTHRFLLPVGEQAKSLTFVSHLWDRFITAGVDRDAVIVAVGGGVVGDVASFAAATFQRGIRIVQLPTTLLSQVDSSIGGKNGINRSSGKNLVGTIVQPDRVLVDPDLLGSLPERELRSGLGEIIKYGLIRDPRILDRLEEIPSVDALLRHPELLDEMIRRSIAIKVAIVARDELEKGEERTLLNFGHTVAHALESAEGFGGLAHGEAVGVGMLAASFLAVDAGLASGDLSALLSRLLRKFGMPTGTAVTPAQILAALQLDKKRRKGQDRWVIVPRPGSARIVADPPAEAVLRALEAIHQPPMPAPETP